MTINLLAPKLLDKHPTSDLVELGTDAERAILVGDIIVSAREDRWKAPGELSEAAQIDRQAITTFVRLPANPVDMDDALVHQPWRIKLESLDANDEPPALELCGDVLVGRAADGIRPDLDLTPCAGTEFGVSRQHALLRPTTSRLLVLDLGSANGTYLNARALDEANPVAEVSDGDILSFGGLHLKVWIIEQP